MKKKNFVIGIWIVVMIGLLYGCGNKEKESKNDSSDLPVITVGCDDYSPYSYADVDGNLTGIDVELAKEAFSRMGYAPKFVFINWEEKKELLGKGEIDCIWSSFTMNDREEEYSWAGPYLTDQGAEVTTVHDGQQAVDLFKESPERTFDLILMDIMMPVMDGLDATRAIRSLDRADAATIPIIAMTANAFKEDADKCMAAGMNAHLAKPLDMEKVKQTIQEQLHC